MNKVVESAEAAVADVFDGATILSGGFGICGIAQDLIGALREKNVKNLTIASNNCGIIGHGLGILLENKQIKKMIASFVGGNKELERQYLAKELEMELNPQGTLAERIRAGGAGIGGFFTPTGAGTIIAEGKETRTLGGREMIFETALKGDFAIVRAWKADTHGNLVYRMTARNFSPMMCTAAKVTIVEAEHIVEPGEIDPDQVHTPGIYVTRVVQAKKAEKFIEIRTTRPS